MGRNTKIEYVNHTEEMQCRAFMTEIAGTPLTGESIARNEKRGWQMAEYTKIEWANNSWSPWIGCSRVHAGCVNCYAEAIAGRFGVTWGPQGTRRKTSEAYWRKPLAWNRQATCNCGAAGLGPGECRVFPSLCDPFEEWPHPIQHTCGAQLTTAGKGDYYPGAVGTLDGLRLATMDDLRRDFFRLIDQTPNLDWLLLTKRPENIMRMWNSDTVSADTFRPTVHLIYSASDQPTLEAGLPHLLACRDLTPVLGLSLEPLLGPIRFSFPYNTRECEPGGMSSNDWTALYWDALTGFRATSMCSGIDDAKINWVVIGGESGPNARPCNIEWIRSIVRQCREAGVRCFVKQLGSRAYATEIPPNMLLHPESYRLFDREGRAFLVTSDRKGSDPSEWPDDLREVRELPE